MNKGRVLNFSGIKLLEQLKNNAYFIICSTFLVIGIIFGLIFFDDIKSLSDLLAEFFADYLNSRENKSFLKIVFTSYFKQLFLFLIVFILGTTLFGVVTIPLTISFCGFFYGSAVAFLYSNFALKGVAFNAAIFLPTLILLLMFLIFASRQAMIFSLRIVKLTLPNSLCENLFFSFRDYALNYLFLTLGAITSALLDGLTSVTMLKFFEF